MKRSRHAARRPGPLAGPALALALLGAALPAAAAQLVKVRVGAHPEFTRVVFELDRAAGYRVEQVESGGAPALRVTVDAASSAHRTGAHGDVRSVEIPPGPSAVAQVSLRRSGLALREMILADPPRIVLDLMRPEPGRAAASRPAPAPPAPAPAVVAKPEAVPAPAVEPEPEQLAQAEPEPEPAPEPVAEPDPEPAAEPEPVETAEAEPPAPALEDPAESPADPALEPGRALLPPAERAAPPPEVPPALAKKPADPAPRPASESAESSGPRAWLDRLTGEPLWLGAVAGGLVVLVGVVVTLRRRSRALPSDLDVAAIAAELDGDAPEGAASSGEDEESPFGDIFADARPAAAPEAPAPAPVAEEPADRPAPPPARGSEFDVEAPAPTSIFDEASQGEAPMNQDMDLPADRRTGPPPPPAMGGSAAGASPDVARMLEDFERRIQSLESKLEQSNEAREKLERQVAAQSEELRVQRAAIARTQRALRTMSRADEDKATEPALRDGDTQAKTRVNV